MTEGGDDERGVIWAHDQGLRKAVIMAAEQSHADAQYKLGEMYANNRGVPRLSTTERNAKAAYYWRQAAQKKHFADKGTFDQIYTVN